MDSSFGQQPAQGAVAPLAVKNSLGRVPPIAMWEICSCVRTAVRARNEPFGQVKIRLFTKGGEEIAGGEAFDFFQKPNPSQSGPTFLQAVSYWGDITGERCAYVRPSGVGKVVAHVLNPMSLAFVTKVLPRFPEDVQQWRYTWDNGILQTFSSDDVIRDIDWNPSSLVRGSSPLYAVLNSVDASYKAQRYLRSFFGNNARPSGVLNVDTDNPDLVDPFKQEYLSAMRGEANAWSTFFTAGKKVTYTPLDAPVPDGPHNPIAMLIKNVRDEVAALYMVPPLHGGMWDQTKFDSVEEQNNFFYESVWLPRVELLQAFAQQINDKHLRFAVPKKKPGKTVMSRSLQARLEKAMPQTDADVVVVIDCDHIPAVSNLKKKKVEYAALLQRTFHMTPEESAVEVGLEIEMNEAAKLVWYETDQTFIEGKPGAPAEELRAAPQPQEDPNKVQESEAKTAKAMESLKVFYRELRRMTLAHADVGSRWTLKEADALARQHNCHGPTVRASIRRAYNALAPMQKAQDKEAIKAYLNAATKTPELRSAAKAMSIESSEPISEEDQKRRKEWLLLLLAFFAWQADKLTADSGLRATAPVFDARLSALLNEQMGKAGLSRIPAGPEWDSARAFVRGHVAEIVEEFAPKLNATTQTNIETGIQNGLTRLDAIEEAVRKAVESRATAIEGDMNHVGEQVGESAKVKEVVWRTERDDRVCPICGPLDGLVTLAGEEFVPGIRWPVVDTHGNCRCRLVEVK